MHFFFFSKMQHLEAIYFPFSILIFLFFTEFREKIYTITIFHYVYSNNNNNGTTNLHDIINAWKMHIAARIYTQTVEKNHRKKYRTGSLPPQIHGHFKVKIDIFF
jgi:hypothetical protein